MTTDLVDITENEIEAMKEFLNIEVKGFYDFYPVKVRESEFGNSLGARTIIYKVKYKSGIEVYAVDGGFLLDPITKRFSARGDPQKFKAIHPLAQNEDLADKLHLYLVATICEKEGSVPKGGADQLAQILGIGQIYKSQTILLPSNDPIN